MQHDDFFFWKVRETLPHLSLGSIICQKTLVVSEYTKRYLYTAEIYTAVAVEIDVNTLYKDVVSSFMLGRWWSILSKPI